MKRTEFRVSAMDCPSEEQLIRSALASVSGIVRLDFDIPNRGVTVWHSGELEPIRDELERLELGSELVESRDASETDVLPDDARDQSRVLRLLLAINATMFVVELAVGWLAESTGLLSDSLDMLADATVYGISLWAVGRAAKFQRDAARISGWFQLVLALGVLAEVVRRAIMGSEPEPPMMIGMATVALAANITCLLALMRHRTGGAHMQASWIFSANDVIANIGVIVAGGLVAWTSSAVPDLIIGAIIGLVVLRGALRILRLARASAPA